MAVVPIGRTSFVFVLEEGGDRLLSMGAAQQHATNSPRFTASMTRRAHSFKRGGGGGGGGESVLQIGNGLNSPRETTISTPCTSPSSQVCSPEFNIDAKKQQQMQQGQNLTFRVRFGDIKFLEKKNVGFDLGIVRERKGLGNFMFVCFCGFFLVLGLIKICATWWVSGYGDSGGIDKVSSIIFIPRFFFASFDDIKYRVFFFFHCCKIIGLLMQQGVNFLHQELENSFGPENAKTLAPKEVGGFLSYWIHFA